MVFKLPHVIAEGFLALRALVIQFLYDKVRALIWKLRFLLPSFAESDAIGTFAFFEGPSSIGVGLDVRMRQVLTIRTFLERTSGHCILFDSPLEKKKVALEAACAQSSLNYSPWLLVSFLDCI